MPLCSGCQRDLPAGTTCCSFCGTVLVNDQLGDQLLDRVLTLLSRGHKLEAIKEVREVLKVSLMDAKGIVDKIDAERSPGSSPETPPANSSWEAAAREMLLQGRKLEAVKLCKAQTGCSLLSAKEQVDALAVKQNLRAKSGCLGIVLLLIALSVLVWCR